MKKLYIVLDSELASGLKMAQACHAMRAFIDEHSELDKAWFSESNNIVVLEHPDIVTFAAKVEANGLKLSRFLEPDLDNALTAICIEPNIGHCCSTLKLAA